MNFKNDYMRHCSKGISEAFQYAKRNVEICRFDNQATKFHLLPDDDTKHQDKLFTNVPSGDIMRLPYQLPHMLVMECYLPQPRLDRVDILVPLCAAYRSLTGSPNQRIMVLRGQESTGKTTLMRLFGITAHSRGWVDRVEELSCKPLPRGTSSNIPHPTTASSDALLKLVDTATQLSPLLILLDDVDFSPGNSPKSLYLDMSAILDAVKQNPHCSIFITTESSALASLSRYGAHVIEMPRFSPVHIATLFCNWMPPEPEASLPWSHLPDRAQVAVLAKHPLIRVFSQTPIYHLGLVEYIAKNLTLKNSCDLIYANLFVLSSRFVLLLRDLMTEIKTVDSNIFKFPLRSDSEVTEANYRDPKQAVYKAVFAFSKGDFIQDVLDYYFGLLNGKKKG